LVFAGCRPAAALPALPYGALLAAARELQITGTSTYLETAISGEELDAVLGRPA